MELKILKQKRIVITGAGSGIGRATAIAFAEEGVRVIGIDQNAAALNKTIEHVLSAGGTASGYTADVSAAQAVDEVFRAIKGEFGTIDFAFNNAGVGQADGQTADIAVTEWERVLRINLDGVWHCMRNELPMMSADGGVIVNTASIGGLGGMPGQAAYAASKHGVIGLTRTAAAEYGPRGIRINAICPTGVMTNMVEQALAGLDEAGRAGALAAAGALHPLGRLATAEDVASLAVFLCSDKASFISGASISVDGARTSHW